MNRGTSYLTSIIPLPARLISDLHAVKKRMSHYPSIKQVAGGNALRYIIDHEYPERFYVLELCDNSITLTVNATTSPLHFLGEALLRITNILTILSEDYECDIKHLLPYIGVALRGSEGITDAVAEKPLSRDVDVILSKRIVELSRRNKAIALDLDRTRSRLLSSISAFLLQKRHNGINIDAVSRELGVEGEHVYASLEHLKELGYKPVTSKPGLLYLVKT